VNIRTRIFLVFAAATVAGFALLAYWISSDVGDRYSESFEEVMVDTANLLAEIITAELDSGDTALHTLDSAFRRLQLRRFSAQIYELEKTRADIRVYVTDDKGIVLFDSDGGKAVGEDYSDWRDVHLTLQGEYGARVTRVSDALPEGDPAQELTVAYVAAPIYRHGDIAGVVTLAKPKDNIDRFVAKAQSNLMLAVAISIGLVLLLGYTLYIWVSRPLQTLVDYAHSIGRGERVQLPQLGDNEIGKVGEAIDSMRQALEDKQYVERYVQSLTHEMKSPLTAIHAAAELLGRELPEESRRQFSETIVKETERLNVFASRLLQLAELEKRRDPGKRESFPVAPLVEDVVAAHAPECESRGLKVRLDQTAAPAMHGDPVLIRQAIDNLYRNAMDFSPPGGSIALSVYPEGDYTVVDFSDEGPGIPDYVGARVFERFFSLPRPDTGEKSTGLGLNFAREVAELHGGSVALENLKPGTRARLKLRHTIST
jgi:two-component system sensor histidine kinase CreC